MTDPNAKRQDARSPDESPSSFDVRVDEAYYFSVESTLNVRKADKPGIGPSGARVHVVYEANDSRVWTDEAKLSKGRPDDDPFAWRGLEGNILSGGDFLLARLDGVLELDGRITIQSRDGSLIDAAYQGLVDLAASIPGQPDPTTQGIQLGDGKFTKEPGTGEQVKLSEAEREQHAGAYDRPPLKLSEKDVSRVLQQREAGVFQSFLERRMPNATRSAPIDVPAALRISFEAASTPSSSAPGEDLSWVSRRYLKHEGTFWRYRRLVRKSFVAVGTIRFDSPGPEGICRMAFDIFELRVKA